MVAPTGQTLSLVSYLAEAAAVFAKLVPRFARRVDAEPVHAARVAARRIQATLWLVRTAQPTLNFPELEARLKVLTKALGARRDLDVALETDAALELLRQRRVATAALAAAASPAAWEPTARALERAVQTIRAAALTLDLAAAKQKLRDRLGRWLTHPPANPVAVHDLRKSLKRTRYILEALDLEVRPLLSAQQTLGRMHDVQVLMQLRGDTKALRKKAAAYESRGLKKAVRALKHARRVLKAAPLPTVLAAPSTTISTVSIRQIQA